MSNHHFPGFAHEAVALSAYIFSIDTFIISLKDSKEITRYVAEDPESFQKWLDENGVRNVNETLGKMVYDYYFEPPAPPPQAEE